MNLYWIRETRKRKRGWQVLALVVILSMLLMAFGSAGPGPVSSIKAQAILLKMAAEQPEQIVQVIVQKLTQGSEVEAEVAALGGTVTNDLQIINAFAASLPARSVLALARRSDVRWVSLDAPMVSAVDPIDTSRMRSAFVQAVGADRVWNEGPAYLQGQGVSVAVVDSGSCVTGGLPCDSLVDPSGASHVVAAASVLTNNFGEARDYYGHGSLVEGVVGSTGSGSKGEYFGIAPFANLVSVRVADNLGMATASAVVDGLQWVLNNKDTYNIRVVNISLNTNVVESYNTSPLDAACEILWFNGIVVVVSAGNNGSATLYAPANDPFVITVGAVDDKGTASLNDDDIASFSAYGVTESGFAKPDLVAPGKNIVSIIPRDKTKIWKDHQANYTKESAKLEYFMRVSGTSFSAPIVAGAVALLLQDEPNLTPDQVKHRLMATANKNWPGYSLVKAGAGTLDIFAAVHGASVDPANLGVLPSQLLSTGSAPDNLDEEGWESVGWNSVGWNSVGWNSVGWNSVGWNSDYWGP